MWRVDRWGISELLAVNNAIRRLPSTADVVAAISLSVKGKQFAYELLGRRRREPPLARS